MAKIQVILAAIKNNKKHNVADIINPCDRGGRLPVSPYRIILCWVKKKNLIPAKLRHMQLNKTNPFPPMDSDNNV